MVNMENQIVTLINVKKYFQIRRGIWGTIRRLPILYAKAVDGVSLAIYEGETLALVGESGSGKTTLGRLILKLIDVTEGYIFFKDILVNSLKGEELKSYRRNVQIIFQDPYGTLDPRYTIGGALKEPLIIHKIAKSSTERMEIVSKILEEVKLVPPDEFMRRFPHQLSGGQRQRVAIAKALILNPKFIVADEPVSMLDVSIRAEILELMKSLKEKFNLTYLYITHDLSTARYIANRIAIMYLGKIVEIGPAGQVIDDPFHPYTQALIAAVPEPNPENKFRMRELKIIGEIPSSVFIPSGCRFHPRCPFAMEICKRVEPELIEIKPNHYVACHLYSGNKRYEDTINIPDKFSEIISIRSSKA
jgi:oligopeptide/dipeptide ABC transporter, ATP-binding protein, C-terminal domain